MGFTVKYNVSIYQNAAQYATIDIEIITCNEILFTSWIFLRIYFRLSFSLVAKAFSSLLFWEVDISLLSYVFYSLMPTDAIFWDPTSLVGNLRMLCHNNLSLNTNRWKITSSPLNIFQWTGARKVPWKGPLEISANQVKSWINRDSNRVSIEKLFEMIQRNKAHSQSF